MLAAMFALDRIPSYNWRATCCTCRTLSRVTCNRRSFSINSCRWRCTCVCRPKTFSCILQSISSCSNLFNRSPRSVSSVWTRCCSNINRFKLRQSLVVAPSIEGADAKPNTILLFTSTVPSSTVTFEVITGGFSVEIFAWMSVFCCTNSVTCGSSCCAEFSKFLQITGWGDSATTIKLSGLILTRFFNLRVSDRRTLKKANKRRNPFRFFRFEWEGTQAGQ